MSFTDAFFVVEASRNSTFPAALRHDPSQLPFPLNSSAPVQIAFSAYLVLVLLSGLRCRKVIYDYLVFPDTKMSPINGLILAHLLSGTLFGSAVLTFAAAAPLLPVSYGQGSILRNSITA
jgi:hypothetical protein